MVIYIYIYTLDAIACEGERPFSSLTLCIKSCMDVYVYATQSHMSITNTILSINMIFFSLSSSSPAPTAPFGISRRDCLLVSIQNRVKNSSKNWIISNRFLHTHMYHRFFCSRIYEHEAGCRRNTNGRFYCCGPFVVAVVCCSVAVAIAGYIIILLYAPFVFYLLGIIWYFIWKSYAERKRIHHTNHPMLGGEISHS